VLKNAILSYHIYPAAGTCKGNQAFPDEPEMIQERRGMQSVVRRYMHEGCQIEVGVACLLRFGG
jgi:hypothetical protein